MLTVAHVTGSPEGKVATGKKRAPPGLRSPGPPPAPAKSPWSSQRRGFRFLPYFRSDLKLSREEADPAGPRTAAYRASRVHRLSEGHTLLMPRWFPQRKQAQVGSWPDVTKF